jgi:hypothetical protein
MAPSSATPNDAIHFIRRGNRNEADLPSLVSSVQHNCDISDARHAGDYGLCTFLLKMREFYRWENELPLGHALPREDLGDWLNSRERRWDLLEGEDYAPLRLADGGEIGVFEAEAANRDLLPRGLVYGAGYGLFHKPVFFLGRLLRTEKRAGFTVLVSSCEYARELAAPPAMLLGHTIYVREESVRRYLWEKIDEWQWRRQDNAMARALAAYDCLADPRAAPQRMAEDQMETMILHEVGEGRAGEMLGEPWRELSDAVARTPGEAACRAVRDLLADCLCTLPGLLGRADRRALHLYFATFDGPRRRLFPQALEAYERFARDGAPELLERVVREGKALWLATAREVLALPPGQREAAVEKLLHESPAGSPTLPPT